MRKKLTKSEFQAYVEASLALGVEQDKRVRKAEEEIASKVSKGSPEQELANYLAAADLR